MDDIIVYDRRDPLSGLTRDAFAARLVAQLRGRVEQAWVFGSYSTREMHAGSDVDLMLVQHTALAFPRRAFEFADLLDIGPTLDILVYTPEEFARLRERPTVGFWQSAVAQMERLL